MPEKNDEKAVMFYVEKSAPEKAAGPESLGYKAYHTFAEAIAIVLLAVQLVIIITIARFLLGPNNIVDSFMMSVSVLCGITSGVLYFNIESWIWGVEKDTPDRATLLLRYGLAIAFLFALFIDSFEYRSKLRAEESRQQSAKFYEELRQKQNSPKYKAGMEWIKRRLEEKKQKREMPE